MAALAGMIFFGVAVLKLGFRLLHDFNSFYFAVLINFRYAINMSLTLGQMQSCVWIGRLVFGLAPNAILLKSRCRACAAPVYMLATWCVCDPSGELSDDLFLCFSMGIHPMGVM